MSAAHGGFVGIRACVFDAYGTLLDFNSAAAGAADTLLQIADDPDLAPVYRRIARFKALGLQAGNAPAAERRAGYEELSVPGSDLRLLADEQIALTFIEEGETDQALEVLRGIVQDAEVTPGLRQRVSQVMVALGADPAASGDAPAGE